MIEKCNNIYEKDKINTDCCEKPKVELKKTRTYMGLSKQYYTRLEDKRRNELKSNYIENTGCCHPNDIKALKKRNSTSRSMMNMKVVLKCCNK